jgi:hypothetical protein
MKYVPCRRYTPPLPTSPDVRGRCNNGDRSKSPRQTSRSSQRKSGHTHRGCRMWVQSWVPHQTILHMMHKWTKATEHILNMEQSRHLHKTRLLSTKVRHVDHQYPDSPSSCNSPLFPPSTYLTPLSLPLAGSPRDADPPLGSRWLSPNTLFPNIMQPIPSAFTVLQLPWRWRQQGSPKRW